VQVGSNKEIIDEAANEAQKIDLNGKLVLPGFTDSHIHFYEWSKNFDYVDLSKALSFEEMLHALKLKAKQVKNGEWILGNGFNETDWSEIKMPDRHDLDKVLPDHPACIWRCDLHIGVANSYALDLAKIDANTPDPPEGIIARDLKGEPTGILRELALNLIKDILPVINDNEVMSNMEKRISELHKLGITTIHDIRLMGGLDGDSSLRAWQGLKGQGKLNIRCHVSLPGEKTDMAINAGMKTGAGDDRLKIGHLKIFADGGMGARTAWMLEKYVDEEYGMPLTSINDIEDTILKAEKAGLSVMIHSIGDRANREIVSMFERIEKKNRIRP
ncbi:MAG: amidohydrolase family protein, partial [Desulfobacteraceae bacterium]|nr:amidohydrolase family protein [Desulfobacteraceae bacterium]